MAPDTDPFVRKDTVNEETVNATVEFV